MHFAITFRMQQTINVPQNKIFVQNLSNMGSMQGLCACSRLNARLLLNKCGHSNAFPCYPLISQTLLCKWRERSVQRYNLGSCHYETRKLHLKSSLFWLGTGRFL